MEIVDVHQHLGGSSGAVAASSTRVSTRDLATEAAAKTAAMDAARIDWAVIQPSHMYLKPEGLRDTMRVNDRIAAFRALAPARFPVAVGTVEPMHGEASVGEVTRCGEELGLNGVSWHHRFQGCYLDTPWMWPILSRMEELGMVPFFHTQANSNLEAPWRLQRLALDFPRLTFVALDGFHNYDVAESVLHLAATTPNILWDLSGPIATWNAGWTAIERWIGRHGAARLVFGADIGYAARAPSGEQTGRHGHSALLDTILASRISEEAKTDILGGNARRALERYLKA